MSPSAHEHALKEATCQCAKFSLSCGVERDRCPVLCNLALLASAANLNWKEETQPQERLEWTHSLYETVWKDDVHRRQEVSVSDRLL